MRVLLVEDDPTTAKSIELMLGHASLNVYTTDLGEEGIDLAKLYDYDLILLDINLPDMNGHEVLRQLRMARIDTPILILSGEDDTDSKLRGFGFGADDYLTKPFHREELIARIHAISVTHPELLVAHSYTRYLGDLSGGQAFRKIARNALNLPEDKGTKFYEFDTIPDLKAFKGRYREALDSLSVSDEMADKIVDEANNSFFLSRSLFKGLEVDLIKVIGQEEFDRIASQKHPGSTEK